ncbi:hypothetical protein D3C73_1330880 [compost metagenome]
MPGRHDQHQRIVAKGQGFERVGVYRVGDDAQVGRTLAQGVGDARAGQFLQVDVEVGVLAQEIGEQFRQVFGDRRGVAQQAHLAFDALGIVSQVLLHAFGLLQQDPGVLGEGFAGRRRGYATTAALQELSTE